VFTSEPRYIDTLKPEEIEALEQRFNDLMVKIVFEYDKYGIKL
jgi:hypothetical protein